MSPNLACLQPRWSSLQPQMAEAATSLVEAPPAYSRSLHWRRRTAIRSLHWRRRTVIRAPRRTAVPCTGAAIQPFVPCTGAAVQSFALPGVQPFPALAPPHSHSRSPPPNARRFEPQQTLPGNQRAIGGMIPVVLHSNCSHWVDEKYRLCADIHGWDGAGTRVTAPRHHVTGSASVLERCMYDLPP